MSNSSRRVTVPVPVSTVLATTALLILALTCLAAPVTPAGASSPSLLPAACTPGPHGGEITSDQTWCAAESPHVISETVTVAAGSALTVEAGSTVLAADYAGLHVLGRFSARGTTTETITFTAQGTLWQGLTFVGSAASADLQHIVVRRGGHGNGVYGGHAMILVSGVQPGQVRLVDSLVTQPVIWNSGYVFGINVIDSSFVMSGTTVSGASGYGGDTGMSVSGASAVVTLTGNTFVGNAGTTLSVNGVGSAVIDHNEFHGNWLAMSIGGDNITVSRNQIHENGASADPRGGIAVAGGSPLITGNLLRNNTVNDSGTVNIGGGSPLLVNNVIVGNHAQYRCSAVRISSGSSPVFKHTTIAQNDGGDGSAICMFGPGATGQFVNTVMANMATGVVLDWASSSLEMTNTLWDNVATRSGGDGTLVDGAPISGKALFDTDGYHLTRQSRAVGTGAAAGVADDVDGEARPLPVGSAPDIGADEYPRSQANVFWMEAYSEPPRLEATEAGGAQIKQDFNLFWNYGSDETSPPNLPVFVTDTLPAEMEFESEETTGSGGVTFQRDEQELTWHTQWPVKKNEAGYIRYTITYNNVQPRQVIDNVVHVTAGPNALSQTVSTEIPFFTPKITYPPSGETCIDQDTPVAGYAMPGSLVRLYADGVSRGLTAADDQGRFELTFTSGQVGVSESIELTAESCSAANPYDCSKRSSPVHMTKQTSFWCPRRSYWQGQAATSIARFHFRNGAGALATNNWLIPVRVFANTTLSLNLCNCPGTLEYPSQVWTMANGTRYDPIGTSVMVFTIPLVSGAVEFHAICDGGEIIDHGTILIDPDGYVFDVTQGFDPVTPSMHAVAGVTVTLMAHEPGLGGWVQWPAHLYDNQVNPQVTGDDGYYAFFTPPGRFHVRINGKAGYQSWRSPVITVTNALVHMNVPLTPMTTTSGTLVNLTVTGPDQPVVHVPAGGTVIWAAEMIPNINEASRRQYAADPVLRPLSALDPLTNTLGWDGGMMAPGQVYQRTMPYTGTYLYDDGLGHTGVVLVGSFTWSYLPLVTRQ